MLDAVFSIHSTFSGNFFGWANSIQAQYAFLLDRNSARPIRNTSSQRSPRYTERAHPVACGEERPNVIGVTGYLCRVFAQPRLQEFAVRLQKRARRVRA
jgi:hypothetical protein